MYLDSVTLQIWQSALRRGAMVSSASVQQPLCPFGPFFVEDTNEWSKTRENRTAECQHEWAWPDEAENEI